MAVSINMPKLGLQMHSGLITEWYVKEGDKVEIGMPVFAIETDKLVTDVEATATGIVLKIVAQAGEEIESYQALLLCRGRRRGLASGRNAKPSAGKDF